MPHGSDTLEDAPLHLRLHGIAEIAHRGREISRPEKDAVDALDRGDLREICQTLDRFHLYHDARFLVGTLKVALDATPARCPGGGARNTAVAPRRIACGSNDTGGLLGRLNHGHEDRLNPDVEILLEDLACAVYWADHRLNGVGSDCLQLGKDCAHIVRRVLRVEAEPVEAHAGQEFRDTGIHHADP